MTAYVDVRALRDLIQAKQDSAGRHWNLTAHVVLVRDLEAIIAAAEREQPDHIPDATKMVSGSEQTKANNLYVECRQCDVCDHVGINDASGDKDACHSCDWRGESQSEDKCPGCGDTNCMAAACPHCGGRYGLLADTRIEQPGAVTRVTADQVDAAITQYNDVVTDALKLDHNVTNRMAMRVALEAALAVEDKPAETTCRIANPEILVAAVEQLTADSWRWTDGKWVMPVQDAVAWIDQGERGHVYIWTSDEWRSAGEIATGRKMTPLYTRPEPAADGDGVGDDHHRAWLAVVDTLNVVSPDWFCDGDDPIKAATAAITALASCNEPTK